MSPYWPRLEIMRHPPFIGFAACALAIACARTDSAADERGLSLVAEVRIADNGEGPAYEFTSIRQIAFHDSDVYVLQNGIPEIRVFDPAGKHRQAIGRSGDGPGEFRSPESMGFIEDTLWTLDGDLRRITFFTAAGQLISTAPYELVSPAFGEADHPMFFPYPKTLLADGRMLGFGGWSGRDIASGKVTATPTLVMSRSGQTLDTIAWVPIGHEHLIFQSAKRTMYREQPYADAPLSVYAADAKRVYVVDRSAAVDAASGAIRVTALESTGDTAWVHELKYSPVRLDAAEVDTLRQGYYKSYGSYFPQSEIDRVLYVPAFRPAVSDAIAGIDGSVWIRWDDKTTPGGVSVIGNDGSVRGSAALPSGTQLKWASKDLLWAVTLDSNDVPSLVRYRVTWPH